MDPPAAWATHPWVSEGAGKLRFGIGLPFWSPTSLSLVENDWSARRDLVQAVDELDFDSLWALDHPSVWADCWTTLTVYAAETRRVRLGPLVSCASYRGAAMLARQAVDVDRISGGRLILGVGAGWFANDYSFLRLPFPPAADRVRHLGETVREVRRLLSCSPPADVFTASAEEVMAGGLAGASVQQPSIPLLVGGHGEKMTLRIVAEYSDMCNVLVQDASEVRHKYSVLQKYCKGLGRSDASIIRSHYLNFAALAESASELADKIARMPTEPGEPTKSFTFSDLVLYYRPLIDAGVQYLILVPLYGIDIATLRLVGEKVIPELQDYYSTIQH